eukprot:TRINITY_DN12139_c0_g2_i1.p1 TRINITY_DN12139_c0_g2~~TRINITY_DN12139_c0_g2_i1.p1  ORF type:complete len:144 (+),score=14.64 TRINITY_DN12139_c0_g2_i1:271-702(+)
MPFSWSHQNLIYQEKVDELRAQIYMRVSQVQPEAIAGISMNNILSLADLVKSETASTTSTANTHSFTPSPQMVTPSNSTMMLLSADSVLNQSEDNINPGLLNNLQNLDLNTDEKLISEFNVSSNQLINNKTRNLLFKYEQAHQ